MWVSGAPIAGTLNSVLVPCKKTASCLLHTTGLNAPRHFAYRSLAKGGYLSVISPVLTVSSEELTFRQWSYENHGLIWRCGAES